MIDNANEVYVLSAARLAIGRFGGTLKTESPADMGAFITKESVKRSGLELDEVQSNVVGHVIRTEVEDAYIARRVALNGGLPISTQSLTVNRLCGSGLEAIAIATGQLALGEVDVAVAGGTESMSRAGHLVTSNRWGQAMGNTLMHDELRALNDPFSQDHMGITAENLSAKYNVTREQQDEFALQSQQRAVNAIEKGYFKEQIVPYEIKTRKGVTVFDTDEHPRADSSLDGLAKLRPVFKPDGGTVTAGNASGINDGAAMVTLASGQKVKSAQLSPMARILSYARCGVPPEIMGIGPVGASTLALKRAGLSVDQLDLIESNEAFAAQALSVSGEMKFPNDKTNPNGGAIALGHPIGASGAILMTKAVYELHRIGGQYALVTLCIGGGQGIAAVIERC